MEPIIAIVSGLIYGLSLLFCYRQGKRDAEADKTRHRAILPQIRKPEPISEQEQAAADRQRRIDAFKG